VLVEELRRIRRMRGLSQQDLAALSGVSQFTITEVETGRREPRPSTLRKLAEALDIEVAELFRPSVTRQSSSTIVVGRGADSSSAPSDGRIRGNKVISLPS
jgi:transcriptional regulator with XRE-family HTH domain